MALKLDDKKAIVAAVHEKAQVALSAVVADYLGLTVGQMTELRKQAREQNVYLRIVRNTLAKKAVVGTEFECLSGELVGPNLFAFSLDDPGAAARLIKDFAKQYEKLEVKTLSVGGVVYPASDIDVLATLPTKEQGISMIMQLLLAPVTKAAMALNDIPGRVVRVTSEAGKAK